MLCRQWSKKMSKIKNVRKQNARIMKDDILDLEELGSKLSTNQKKILKHDLSDIEVPQKQEKREMVYKNNKIFKIIWIYFSI